MKVTLNSGKIKLNGQVAGYYQPAPLSGHKYYAEFTFISTLYCTSAQGVADVREWVKGIVSE